jgi:hypothetical protein
MGGGNGGIFGKSTLYGIDMLNLFGTDKKRGVISMPGSTSVQKKKDAEHNAVRDAEAATAALAAEKEASNAKKIRSSLFKNSNGVEGEEILSGGTQKRSTIFGNV